MPVIFSTDLILWPLKRGTGQIHPATSTFCEYFIRAEARCESVNICWLENAWILQVNSNLMQYCTKRNECESETFALRTKEVALFPHCHTLNFYFYLSSHNHIFFCFKCWFSIPHCTCMSVKNAHTQRCKREEKWERSALTPLFSLCTVFVVICWFIYFVGCVISYVYVYYFLLFLWVVYCTMLLGYFILLLYSTFLNKCPSKYQICEK